jgi:uncharacterized delta-60 repeat protein
MTSAKDLSAPPTMMCRGLTTGYPLPERTHHTAWFACAVLICVSSLAAAQAGHLDTTFGSAGIFTFSLTTNNGSSNQASAVALQSDGKIVVAGQLGSRSGLLRLTSNGSLDSSFGKGGVVVTKIGGVILQNFGGLAIQSDGKIVVAATGVPARGQVARFNSNGSLDTAFGSNGIARLPGAAGLLTLQPDGKIVVTGSNAGFGSLVRLQANGQPDTSFGTNGQAPLLEVASSIALQSDGKILTGAFGFFAPGAGLLARYNTDGSLDRSFGISGQAASTAPPSAIAVQSDGKILAAGANVSQLSLTGNASGFGLARFNSNGSIDTTFATRGGVTTGFPTTNTTADFAVAVQSNGDIVAAGEAGNNGTSRLVESFALARYLGTGKLDSTFGTGGLVTTNFGSNAVAFITSIVLQSDGKIVVAGADGLGGVGVARYLGQ